jgi:thymidylate kinase
LKNGVEDLEELQEVKGTRREIEIRMMMFALDRLQALESILRGTEKERGVLLLDRGPYSNALTIAYGLSVVKEISEQDVREMTQLGFDMEQYLIETLNLDNCVVQLSADYGKEGWKSIRAGGEDQLERREVQERAEDCYLQFSQFVGEGWKKVITKADGRWKTRNRRNKEIQDFLEERLQLQNLKLSEDVRFDSIDVLDISKDMYNLEISKLSCVKDFYEALESNKKNLIYEKGLTIAKYIATKSESVSIKDEGVKKAMYNIVEAYPECFVLLEQYYGAEFVKILKEAIYD